MTKKAINIRKCIRFYYIRKQDPKGLKWILRPEWKFFENDNFE